MVKAKLEPKQAKTATTYLLAIDIGFGDCKGISSAGKKIVFPSTVEPAKPSNSNLHKSTSINQDRLVVTTNDGTYAVGKYAMNLNPLTVSSRTINRDRANDPKFRTEFHTMAGMLIPDDEEECNVFIVTGLPNDDFEKDILGNLEAFIKESFTTEFHLGGGNKKIKKVNVTGTLIVRQPEGSVTFNHFDFIASPELLQQSVAYRSYSGIIDIGHLTTDYAFFIDGQFSEAEGLSGSTVGTREMYIRLQKKIEKFISKEYGVEHEPTDRDLDEAVRTKKITIRTMDDPEPKDVATCVEEAAEEIAEKIASVVLAAWGQHSRSLESILLAGGGAYIFAEALRERFAMKKVQGFTVINEAQMTNVYGFYMLGATTLVEEDDSNVESIYQDYIVPVFGTEVG